jgi:hypothetical protein
MVRMLTRVRKKRQCSPGHRLFLIPSTVDRMEFRRYLCGWYCVAIEVRLSYCPVSPPRRGGFVVLRPSLNFNRYGLAYPFESSACRWIKALVPDENIIYIHIVHVF